MIPNTLRKAVNLINFAEGVMISGATWQRKYAVIFELGIVDAIRATGSDISWCDPDSDYEDDVTAFMAAVRAWRDDVVKMFKLSAPREEQLLEVLREFITDVEAVGSLQYILEDLEWLDLLVTYRKAKALVDGVIIEIPEHSET